MCVRIQKKMCKMLLKCFVRKRDKSMLDFQGYQTEHFYMQDNGIHKCSQKITSFKKFKVKQKFTPMENVRQILFYINFGVKLVLFI